MLLELEAEQLTEEVAHLLASIPRLAEEQRPALLESKAPLLGPALTRRQQRQRQLPQRDGDVESLSPLSRHPRCGVTTPKEAR